MGVPSVGSVGGQDAGAEGTVRKVGLEPTRPKAQEPKSCVSADFTTPASGISLLSDLDTGWGVTPDPAWVSGARA